MKPEISEDRGSGTLATTRRSLVAIRAGAAFRRFTRSVAAGLGTSDPRPGRINGSGQSLVPGVWHRRALRVVLLGVLALLVVACGLADTADRLTRLVPSGTAEPLGSSAWQSPTPLPTLAFTQSRSVASPTPLPARIPPTPRLVDTQTPTPARESARSAVAEPVRPAVAESAVGSGLPTDVGAVARVARKVRPAVVNISALQVSVDEFLRPVPEEAGVGSGVIFDKKGLILTNNHVVAVAEKLRVTLPDGRSFDGTVVGADPRGDLAVVQIAAENLPTAELGDSDRLEIGEWVVAIGNALALDGGPTVTVGVVGALDRYITTSDGNVLFDLIQTDAAINPGNSGGPLLDLSGQVIGVNTAMAQAPGAGIGFAIAINRVKPAVAELIANGRVSRPWLGIQPVSVNASLAAQYGLPTQEGVLVARLERGGPAAAAGVRVGDVVVAIEGEPIRSVVSLTKTMVKYRAGQKVKVTVARAAGQQVYVLALEELPE